MLPINIMRNKKIINLYVYFLKREREREIEKKNKWSVIKKPFMYEQIGNLSISSHNL
jgi:hypothetical protein